MHASRDTNSRNCPDFKQITSNPAVFVPASKLYLSIPNGGVSISLLGSDIMAVRLGVSLWLIRSACFQLLVYPREASDANKQ